MLPKVSVIVPIYKVEKYLNRAVDSILNQTLREIEIILVDDGSPDRCPAICDSYALKDSRIKVVHKPNGGLSDARNAGLKIATGEYISFVDSDDYIEPDMLYTLYFLGNKENADIVTGGFFFEDESGKTRASKFYLQEGTIGRDEIYSRMVAPIFGDESSLICKKMYGYAWLNLYKTNIITCNNIHFSSERVYYHEDEVFLFDFLYYAEKAAICNRRFYHYINRKGSLMRSARSNKWEMALALIQKYKEAAVKFGLEEQCANLIQSTILFHAFESVVDLCYPNPQRSTEDSITGIQKILDHPDVKAILKSGRKFKSSIQIKYFLYLMRSRSAESIYRTCHNYLVIRKREKANA